MSKNTTNNNTTATAQQKVEQKHDYRKRTVGVEFQINSYTTSYQMYLAVSTLPSGDFVVVWQSDGQDGNLKGIYGHIFPNTTSLPTTAVSSSLSSSTTSGFTSSSTSSVTSGVTSGLTLGSPQLNPMPFAQPPAMPVSASSVSSVSGDTNSAMSLSTLSSSSSATSSTPHEVSTPETEPSKLPYLVAGGIGVVAVGLLLAVCGFMKYKRSHTSNNHSSAYEGSDTELTNARSTEYSQLPPPEKRRLDLGYVHMSDNQYNELPDAHIMDSGYGVMPDNSDEIRIRNSK